MGKTVKKILCLMLSVVIIVSFAGCGKNESSAGTSASTGTGGSTSASAQSEKKSDPVTLKWIFQAPPQEKPEPVLKAMNEQLLSKYNLQLDAEFVAIADYDSHMNMVVSSGEYYDLCNTSTNRNKYLPNIAKGALLALDEPIKKYHPDFYSILPEALFDNARVGGVLYAIPNYQAIYRQWGVVVRHDLVQKYNWKFDNVKKFSDLEPYLKQVAEKEKQLYTIDLPWGGEPEYKLDNRYYAIDTYTYVKYDDPYKVYYPWDEVYNWNMLKHQWWEKGLLRSDVATTQTVAADEKAGKYAFIETLLKAGFEVEADQRYGADYDVVALQQPYLESTAGRSTMNGINALTKHPKEALDMIYVMNTDKDIYNMLNYGIKDVNYKLDNDGKVAEIPNSGYFLNYAWSYGNNLNALLQAGQANDIWTLTDKYNKEAKPSPLPGFTMDTTKITDLVTQLSALEAEFKYIEYQKNFEDLSKKMKTAMEPYINQYNAECQKQLDEWKAKAGTK